MTIGEVKSYFQNKEHTPCPLTERLVKAGYQQISGGYIDTAKWKGIKVNYKENTPSQYWHLMNYCNRRDADMPFTKRIVCGELIFWMTEVSGAVETEELEKLCNQIIESADLTRGERPVYDRKKWNFEIQRVCFDKIAEIFIDKTIPLVAVNKEINDARTIAIKKATEKGWKEDDVFYLTKDGDSFIFGLYMPLWGDFGAPAGVKVSGINSEIITLNHSHLDLLSRDKLFPEFEQKLREMIARCEWTFAKTMPWCPHEYIVKDKCPLSAAEFTFFVDIQRSFGVNEQWGKYNNPYLYIDDYKYWTMGAPIYETTVINRAKVSK